MIKDKIGLKGSLVINVYDKDMKFKKQYQYNNLVTNVGKNYIVERMTSNNAAIMSHMALGTTNSSPVLSETVLGNEVGRAVLDLPLVITNNVISYVATFVAGVATGSLKEAGIFNASIGGTMLNKAQIDVPKSAEDTIVVSWNLAVQ